MSLNCTLPDLKTEPLKLGKGPRRNARYYLRWGNCPYKRKTKDYDGTPAARTPIRHAAAFARLLFWTRAEAEAEHMRHLEVLRSDTAKMHREGRDEKTIETYWIKAEASTTYTVPAWLGRELDQHHGRKNIERGWGATAVWTFNGADKSELTRWCDYVEQRDAEQREVDDQAFAALTNILKSDCRAVE